MLMVQQGVRGFPVKTLERRSVVQSVNAVLSRIRELQVDLPPEVGQIAGRVSGKFLRVLHSHVDHRGCR